MKKTFHFFILNFIVGVGVVFGQLPDKVGGLITADRNAAGIAEGQSPHAGLSAIIDKESVFYVPSEVNAYNYLNNRPNIPDKMSWSPNLALVSKSLDWGVTSGRIEFQKVGAIKRYGQYVTVWKRNKKGAWVVNIKAEVENFGKNSPKELLTYEPDDSGYLKHRSQARLKQREDIVFSTDELFSTVMKADNQSAYKEFLTDDVRFYYPWQEEMEGKQQVLNFLKQQRIEIVTDPVSVGRAYSGEYAYTMGDAVVYQKDKEVKFSYIRVWKKENANWRVMLEMLFER